MSCQFTLGKVTFFDSFLPRCQERQSLVVLGLEPPET